MMPTKFDEWFNANCFNGIGIAYHVLEDEWKEENGRMVRYIKKMDIINVGVKPPKVDPEKVIKTSHLLKKYMI